MTNDGVHASHCCKDHGCKYGDADCPVVSGRIPQKHLCETCDFVREEITDYVNERPEWVVEELQKLGYKVTPPSKEEAV